MTNDRMRAGRRRTLVVRRHSVVKSIASVGTAIGQGSLEVRPDELVGIQFRRVAGEALDVQARILRQEGAHVRALVDGAAVPDDDDVFPEVPQQQAEEDRDLDVGDIVRMEVDVQAEATTLSTDGDGGDRGNLVAAVAMPQDRGLAPGRPAALGQVLADPDFVIAQAVGGDDLGQIPLVGVNKRALGWNRILSHNPSSRRGFRCRLWRTAVTGSSTTPTALC